MTQKIQQKQSEMAYFAFGSNLSTPKFPNPIETVAHSIRALASADIELIACGLFYETEPVPKSDQPWYVNTVAAYRSNLSGQELLDRALELELEIGRQRSVPNAARVIDIDLIDWAGETLTPTEDAANPLYLPHPRAHERAFVLYPLQDLDPTWRHPDLNTAVDELIAGLGADQVLGLQIKKLAIQPDLGL